MSSLLNKLSIGMSYLYHILLLGLLVTFIIFIIQYMDGIKKNFWDINTLLIAYSAILIIPFCFFILGYKGKNIKTYLYELIVLGLYIINTSIYSSLNIIHPIKGDIVSSIFHILFIIISILLFISVFGITSRSNSVKEMFNPEKKKLPIQLLIISLIFILVNNIGVFYGVIDKKNNHSVDT